MKHGSGIRSIGAMVAAGAFLAVAVVGGPAMAARPVPVPGDANKDGVVDCADRALIIDNWTWGTAKLKTRDARAADLNNDKAVNVLDLSILISNWTDPTVTCE